MARLGLEPDSDQLRILATSALLMVRRGGNTRRIFQCGQGVVCSLPREPRVPSVDLPIHIGRSEVEGDTSDNNVSQGVTSAFKGISVRDAIAAACHGSGTVQEEHVVPLIFKVGERLLGVDLTDKYLTKSFMQQVWKIRSL